MKTSVKRNRSDETGKKLLIKLMTTSKAQNPIKNLLTSRQSPSLWAVLIRRSTNLTPNSAKIDKSWLQRRRNLQWTSKQWLTTPPLCSIEHNNHICIHPCTNLASIIHRNYHLPQLIALKSLLSTTKKSWSTFISSMKSTISRTRFQSRKKRHHTSFAWLIRRSKLGRIISKEKSGQLRLPNTLIFTDQ